MKTFEFFANEKIKQFLIKNELKNFQTIWKLDIGWFEDRNVRRGGWSGVSQHRVDNGKGLFIKRQENHCYRSWDGFFLPVATFYREFKNIQRFVRNDIPTLELLYYGQRKEEGGLQAILITNELDGYSSLDSGAIKEQLDEDFKLRRAAIKKIAEVVSLMHESHFQHNCLYEKHVFIKVLQDGSVDVRLIDLEKVKWKPFKAQAMYRDLGSLFRHSSGWNNRDCLRFFLFYQKEKHLSNKSKKTLNTFIEKVKQKQIKSNKSDA